MVFVCLEIYPRICYRISLAIYFVICHDGKIIKKNHGPLEFASSLMKISGDYETLSIAYHVGLQVDFLSMKSSLGL